MGDMEELKKRLEKEQREIRIRKFTKNMWVEITVRSKKISAGFMLPVLSFEFAVRLFRA